MCRRLVNIGIVLFLGCVVLFVVAIFLRPSAEQAATQTAQAIAALPTLAVLPSETPVNDTLATQISDAETRSAEVNDLLSTNIARATEVELTLSAPSLASTTVQNNAGVTPIIVAQSSTQTLVFTDVPSATFAPTSTLTPSETITNTITPSLTSTATITLVPSATLTPVPVPISMTLYAQGSVNVRNCPRKSCTLIDSLTNGEAVSVDAQTDGEAVRTGNTVWYRIRIAGLEGYVYSDYVTDQVPPTAPPPPAAPMVFQGTQAQVLGPLTFPAGLYRARVTTTGFFIAQLQVTQGDCEGDMFTSLFALMEGQANGAEAVLTSSGCTTFIAVSDITAPWKLEISQIG